MMSLNNKMNLYVYILLGIAAFLLYASYYTAQVSATQCPEKIVYRYVPRTYAEELQNPVPMDELYAQMFDLQGYELAKDRGFVNEDRNKKPEDETNFYTNLVPFNDSAFGRSMSV